MFSNCTDAAPRTLSWPAYAPIVGGGGTFFDRITRRLRMMPQTDVRRDLGHSETPTIKFIAWSKVKVHLP